MKKVAAMLSDLDLVAAALLTRSRNYRQSEPF